MKTIVFDNNGTSFDRYTIVLPDGETFGASQHPFNPQGFGQYCGNVVELVYSSKGRKGYDDKTGGYPKDCIKRALIAFKRDCKENGETIIRVNKLPEDVQIYIKQLESNS